MAEATVMICAYNAASYINDALGSACAQQGIDWEVLVVDDGSTDETVCLVEAYAEKHNQPIRIVRCKHRGLSATRNTGYEQCRTEFVCNLDADDEMHTWRLRAEVEGLHRFPHAAYCFSNKWSFLDGYEEGIVAYNPTKLLGQAVPPGIYEIFEPLAARVHSNAPPGTSAYTSRTEFLRAEGRFDEQQKSFIDGEQWIRTLTRRSVAFCTEPLYYRREVLTSLSASTPERLQMVLRAIGKAWEHWQNYSEAQQLALTTYAEKFTITQIRRAIAAGDLADARKLLRTYGDRISLRQRCAHGLLASCPLAPMIARAKKRRTAKRLPKICRADLDTRDVAAALGLSN